MHETTFILQEKQFEDLKTFSLLGPTASKAVNWLELDLG